LIRVAEAHDVSKLAETLSHAFNEDPVISWVIRDDDKRPDALRRLFSYILREGIPHSEVTTTQKLDACAVWLPPGVWTEPPGPLESLRMLPETLRWTGLGRLQRYRDMDAAEFAKRPREPHFYLAILGVKPGRRGHGLGSALLSHTLSRLDDVRLPAYLENSKEANAPLYEHHGFKVVDEIRLRGGGPTMWCMWREPASGAQGN